MTKWIHPNDCLTKKPSYNIAGCGTGLQIRPWNQNSAPQNTNTCCTWNEIKNKTNVPCTIVSYAIMQPKQHIWKPEKPTTISGATIVHAYGPADAVMKTTSRTCVPCTTDGQTPASSMIMKKSNSFRRGGNTKPAKTQITSFP